MERQHGENTLRGVRQPGRSHEITLGQTQTHTNISSKKSGPKIGVAFKQFPSSLDHPLSSSPFSAPLLSPLFHCRTFILTGLDISLSCETQDHKPMTPTSRAPAPSSFHPRGIQMLGQAREGLQRKERHADKWSKRGVLSRDISLSGIVEPPSFHPYCPGHLNITVLSLIKT